METLRALIRGDLAPAGNKISLAADLAAFSYPVVGYHANWVNSGTSALALALADVKQKAPHIEKPTVIIPAYCCPDLIAAAVYAGVRPVAVDINKNDPAYDLAELKAAINENVVAVIAVNFLGIKERLKDIRALLLNTSIALIEDNAQWFPASSDEHDFSSDYILFTFGRGKPLSLLGGGVLFSREQIVVPEFVRALNDAPGYDLKQHGKLIAYNLLLHPHLYCYINRAPILKLGETRYCELTDITALDSYRKALFGANLSLHATRNKIVEHAYDGVFHAAGIQQLASINSDRRMRLLRYPLLCENKQLRSILLHKLTASGLGASPMYQRSIAEVSGVERYIDIAGDIKNARHFAECFLTLPTHEHVTAKHILRVKDILLTKR